MYPEPGECPFAPFAPFAPPPPTGAVKTISWTVSLPESRQEKRETLYFLILAGAGATGSRRTKSERKRDARLPTGSHLSVAFHPRGDGFSLAGWAETAKADPPESWKQPNSTGIQNTFHTDVCTLGRRLPMCHGVGGRTGAEDCRLAEKGH